MRKVLTTAFLAVVVVLSMSGVASATSSAVPTSTPYGTLTSNAWHQTGDGTLSGSARLWDYQVSAVYSGSNSVERIRTTWRASASLRNSASLDLGISSSGVSVGSSSSWATVSTPTKYWENTNGAKTSSYRTNAVVTPQQDFRSGTFNVTNTALLKIRGDARTWQISASA